MKEIPEDQYKDKLVYAGKFDFVRGLFVRRDDPVSTIVMI